MFLKLNSFNLDKSNNIKTSIQINLDGFSFSRYDMVENRLIDFNFTPAHVSNQKFIAQRVEEWLEFNNKSIKLWGEIRLIVSYHFSLVPEDYVPENKKAYVSALFDLNSENTIIEQNIKDFGIHILFIIPAGLFEIFNKRKIEIKPEHPVKIIVENFLKIEKEKEMIALYFNSRDFTYVLADSQGLKFINNFRFNHPNDILYYLIAINKQTGINPLETKILLSGDIIEHDDKYNKIIRIFSDLEFLEANPLVSISPGIFGHSTHRFITHFLD